MMYTITFWRHSALGDRMDSVDVPGVDRENAITLWISKGGDTADIASVEPQCQP